MCTDLSPWQPNARGTAYKLVAELTAGMLVQSVDPLKSGVCILSGGGKKMWVWQDRAHWTDHPGPNCLLTGVPARAIELRIYGWDGLRKTVALSGSQAVRIGDLPGNETYMFVANAAGTSDIGAVDR
jgi:hypothetical protein